MVATRSRAFRVGRRGNWYTKTQSENGDDTMRILVCLLALIVTGTPTNASALWEELFAAKSGDIEARVELRKYSFRKQLRHGEKVIVARLKMFYQDGQNVNEAESDYEIHCAERKAFRSDMVMQVTNAQGQRTRINNRDRTALVGKEYQDFVGIMDILCRR